MVRRIYYSILILLLLFFPATSLAVQLETITDRTQTSLEESFSLELRATGSIDGEPDLTVLEKDFEILGRSQSSQVQIINSDISRTTVWNLSLLARSAGKKQIPPICIGRDCSDPVIIEVLPAGQGNSASTGESELLLEVSVAPEKLWVQSQLLYKVRLLTRLNFLQASLSEPQPSGVEAVVQKFGEDRNFETERNGIRYRVVERHYALFPQQSGRLTIPPIIFSAQIAEGGRRGFDPYIQRTRQIRKQSNEISIEVLPATDSKGRNWLPANDLRLEDDWQQPLQLTVGEPATRTITLRASGLPSAQLPLLNIQIPEGVRSYPDQPNREDQFNENGILGILEQKLALVPTTPGTLHLPEVKIDWWDLQAERWRQTLLPAITVEVLPATDQSPVSILPPAEQLNPSKVEDGPQTDKPITITTIEPGFWPWLSLILGSGWLMTLIYLVKNMRGHNNRAKAQKPEEETPCLKKSRKSLQQAIKAGDQTQLRSALLNWGGALFPEHPPANLEELATLCGEPLKQQIEAFNRSLYSKAVAPWDTHELLKATQFTEQKQMTTKSIDQMPKLYP